MKIINIQIGAVLEVSKAKVCALQHFLQLFLATIPVDLIRVGCCAIHSNKHI